ncbi:MAG: ester cyclase [Chloroflexi bacterium]|nr:ester cyclase [Chloroflexota bacterium]
MSTEQNKAIIRQFVAAADKGNIDGAAAYLAPELKVHMAGAPGPLDRATFLQFGTKYHTAFPDELTIFEDQIAEGDTVVSRMTSTVTHQGNFQGMPPTGKQIRVSGIWIDRVVEDKIVERWGVIDQMGFMQQLGVMAAPGQGGS